jgi:hypothetical protein
LSSGSGYWSDGSELKSEEGEEVRTVYSNEHVRIVYSNEHVRIIYSNEHVRIAYSNEHVCIDMCMNI